MSSNSDIVALCRQNTISTAEVADAMGKTGAIPLLSPVNSGHYCVGPIRCVFAANESNFDVHDQIRDLQPGEIPVIFAHNCDGRAIIGDVVAKFLLVHKKAEAVVVQGLVRDTAELIKRQYAVWSMGSSPIGCFNSSAEPFPEHRKNELLERYQGAIAVCDDAGVVSIPNHLAPEVVLERLTRIQIQESIWNFCLDELGWDTKKIVCEKGYLNDLEIEKLPLEIRDKITLLRKGSGDASR